jgi:hydrogenase expression/formation protein HypC
MCLAIPAQLKSRTGTRGLVIKDGLQLDVDLSFLPEAEIGDHLVIHAGIALSIVHPEDLIDLHHLSDIYLNPSESKNEN